MQLLKSDARQKSQMLQCGPHWHRSRNNYKAACIAQMPGRVAMPIGRLPSPHPRIYATTLDHVQKGLDYAAGMRSTDNQ